MDDAVKAMMLSILLAEDKMVNQKLAVKLLEIAGHKVEVADNGEIATEMYNLIREFEEQGGVARTPIIALTAHAMIGDRERCLESGMDEYVTKPVRRGDILAALAKVFSPVPKPGASPETAPIFAR
ncbi:hypothetical protein JCM24511_06607 [Saitozyma sp. JCM 24511]|nr:hypothetical protein JCM24511_06607 [Saitozyma sp. JCM 24511]